METFTWQNFVSLVESAEGTPYLYGGIDPFHGGADCSGLIYWAALQCGVTLPRTTEAEWADLPHVADPNLGGIQIGDIVEFEVPSDGGSPPQHVGVWLGPGTMIDDPETGEVVSVQVIPRTSGIWPIGYCRLPFVAGPAPVPTPPPLLVREVNNMNCTDPQTGGEWIVDLDGHIETWPNRETGATPPFLGAINYPGPWGDWQAGGVVWGIRAAQGPDGQWGYDIIYRHNTPFSPPGGAPGQYFSPFSFYRP